METKKQNSFKKKIEELKRKTLLLSIPSSVDSGSILSKSALNLLDDMVENPAFSLSKIIMPNHGSSAIYAHNGLTNNICEECGKEFHESPITIGALNHPLICPECRVKRPI